MRKKCGVRFFTIEQTGELSASFLSLFSIEIHFTVQIAVCPQLPVEGPAHSETSLTEA